MDYLKAFQVLCRENTNSQIFSKEVIYEAKKVAMIALLECAKRDFRCCIYCQYYDKDSRACFIHNTSASKVEYCYGRSLL